MNTALCCIFWYSWLKLDVQEVNTLFHFIKNDNPNYMHWENTNRIIFIIQFKTPPPPPTKKRFVKRLETENAKVLLVSNKITS
jgi:hypothetical protein